jgi:carotenoid cleavage dioxygenase-like enzyme
LYKGHRYPPEIIAHCVWLYHRFPLSFREVEELMLQRGVVVSYETIRQWCAKFGQAYANQLRRPVPQGRFRRYRLAPGGSTAVDEPVDTPFEWPRINYRACNARPYRYAYGAGAVTNEHGIPAAAITKLDIDDGAAIHWVTDHCYPGEPVFVTRPGGHGEDDGIVLSIVFEPQAGGSFLLVLDGRDLSEYARVYAPHRLPFGFHGDFFPATDRQART